MAAWVDVQRRLFASGSLCPEPLTGAAPFGDGVATAEAYAPGGTLLPSGGRSAWAFAGALARLVTWPRGQPRCPRLPRHRRGRTGITPGPGWGRSPRTLDVNRNDLAGGWTRAYDASCQHAVGQPVRSLTEHAARERLHRAGIG